MDTLRPGLKGETSFVVEDKTLANVVGSGLVSVFSTAMMIAGLEEAAVKCVQDFLPEGYTTVGVHIDVSHKAATPPGIRVFFKATLTNISANGKRLDFGVEASDEYGLIGEGEHQRVIVKKKAFEEKARLKAKAGNRVGRE